MLVSRPAHGRHWPRAVPLVVAALGLWMFVAWVDRTLPEAGLWVLLGLSSSTGLVHGVLDSRLLMQRVASRAHALTIGILYLFVVVIAAVVFTMMFDPSIALFALIALSMWHFGEGFGRWPQTGLTSGALTRLVVGGVAVVIFPWTVPVGSILPLLPWLSIDSLQAWRGLGIAWLAMFIAWTGFTGLPQWRNHRYAWAELAGVAALNLSLSPVMAFAIYFGGFHASMHIWRVWRCRGYGSIRESVTWIAVGAAMVLTIGVVAHLWVIIGPASLPELISSDGLRWLIIALAALTLPHLFLISACDRLLSRGRALL